tara:strand:- start:5352 stop:6146 length:795 start_codon:yes stop_codon:yes gene_type:complete
VKKIILLTGTEPRHNYFKQYLASQLEIHSTYCEGLELSLENQNKGANQVIQDYIQERKDSEINYFSDLQKEDNSRSMYIKKGEINNLCIQNEIIKSSPDLVLCFGSSIIKEPLVSFLEGKCINMHLGLSPYYRGSGTNYHALVDGYPEYVGITFLFLDPGIDTGHIIHQIQADYHLNDTVHDIGHRLIKKGIHMLPKLAKLYPNFELEETKSSVSGKLVKRKDFTTASIRQLKNNLKNDMIQNYLNNKLCRNVHLIQQKAIMYQ